MPRSPARSREGAVPSAGCGGVGLARRCPVAAADMSGCRAQGLVRAEAGRGELESLGVCPSAAPPALCRVPWPPVCRVGHPYAPDCTKHTARRGQRGPLCKPSQTREVAAGSRAAGQSPGPVAVSHRDLGSSLARAPQGQAAGRGWTEGRLPCAPVCPDKSGHFYSGTSPHRSPHGSRISSCPLALGLMKVSCPSPLSPTQGDAAGTGAVTAGRPRRAKPVALAPPAPGAGDSLL